MFENFPKTRPELPEEYKKIYDLHYKQNREGQTAATSLSMRLESWLHKKVADDVKGTSNKSTLEIGAGTLNQLDYEDTKPYDIIEPFTSLYEKSEKLSRIRSIYKDISEIPEGIKYDRITAVAVFEHITNLPEVVEKTCKLLNPGGTLRVSIPNEGKWPWKFGTLITGLEFKSKYGLDYQVLMKHEHVNTADEIEEVLKYFYKNVKCKCFGLNRTFAFYRFYECTRLVE